ncbi:MAG: NAD(P)/FAD-dependent oxidoreductase, partial [Dehalococcoidia bacterium]|nr:NAD(P)/FAD-dependent oxidoreductase [Dehalococcoidia bacterium]
MLEYDIAVIGAGPIGSYTAARLAEAGHRVAVFEASSNVDSNVCCTGIVSTDCYNQFIAHLGIPARPARSANVFSPSGQSLHIEKPETQAYIIDRPALNRALYERARLLSVDYYFNSYAVNAELSTNRCSIRLQQPEGDRTIAAKIIVAACGLSSIIPRKLGLGHIKHCAVGAQVNVKTDVEEVEVYFDQEMAPGGFAWLVPTWDGDGLAGIISQHNAVHHLRPFIERLYSSGKITRFSTLRHKAIPIWGLRKTSTDRVLVVGEAAGQVKPTTFGGIYTGMLSAGLAATTIKEALATSDLSGRKLAEYDRA